MTGAQIRTRIAPAPSGDLHVGNVRTALYNWVMARQQGGQFILRIEDTDRSRVSDEAIVAVQEILSWVGLDWDEGPGIGGPWGPYRQSERFPIYAAAVETIVGSGAGYRCYCTTDELAERNQAARAAGRPPGYDGRCHDLTPTERAELDAAGRAYAVRFRMPPGATSWDDLVRGTVTVEHKDIPDFALTRSDGGPLYILAAAVDDVAMHVTHVVRGEDLLSATPRQLALYAALGADPTTWPRFGHLPLLVGEDNKPLSKRNGEVSLRWYRDNGFLPEAVLNYLALLGWSLDAERDLFDLEEMVAAFDVGRVSKNPARFDLRKLEAINGHKLRALTAPALAQHVRPLLEAARLTVDDAVLQAAVPLIQERMNRLTESVDLLWFLFVDEADFHVVDGEAASEEGAVTVAAALVALGQIGAWTAGEIEAALRTSLIDGLGRKPKQAFAPLRLAVTGRRISPPLFESMELLGPIRTLSRLASVAARTGASDAG